MAKKKLKCCLYTRVSTQIQVEVFSLEAQHERLPQEAKHREMEIYRRIQRQGQIRQEYHGPPGIPGNDAMHPERQSGRRQLRPGIQIIPVRAKRSGHAEQPADYGGLRRKSAFRR